MKMTMAATATAESQHVRGAERRPAAPAATSCLTRQYVAAFLVEYAGTDKEREENHMAAVKPIPEGYPRVTPYLAIDGASDAIDFYKKIFGATERFRMPGPDGRI